MNPSNAKSNSFLNRSQSTPLHDALQLWLFYTDNQITVASLFGPDELREEQTQTNWSWAYDIAPNDTRFRYDDAIRVVKDVELAGMTVEILDKKTEFPIYGYNRYILGIVDCQIKVKRTWDYKITKTPMVKHFPDGYHDYYKNVTDAFVKCPETCEEDLIEYLGSREDNHEGSDEINILCEIKPKLDSVGSIISQIKIYQDYIFERTRIKCRVALITLDRNRIFDEMLLSEGIRIIRVPQDEIPIE